MMILIRILLISRIMTGFSLDIWIAIACSVVSAITLAFLTTPWTLLKTLLRKG
jgi:hypothetical protein